MNLDKLIQEGEVVRKECSTGTYITGEKYEIWISKCILYLDGKDGINVNLIQKFKTAAERAVGNGEEYLNTMMGVLKALKEFGWE